ncbi:MAG: GNAT superfamily N-acetyltransferase [Halobacteriales archaeon]|jgi:GNAT superfamily N-acetyltransferase
MIAIEREKAGARTAACLRLARGLDEGFTENGLATMADGLPDQRTVVGLDDGDVVGFVSIEECTPNVSELGWFAVANGRQGEGTGTELLADVYEDRRAAGPELLAVKTLADTVEDENYARTRAFYEEEGFRYVETLVPHPEWDPGNPCAIYVNQL